MGIVGMQDHQLLMFLRLCPCRYDEQQHDQPYIFLHLLHVCPPFLILQQFFLLSSHPPLHPSSASP